MDFSINQFHALPVISSLSSTLHFYRYDNTWYITSDGALENFYSMDILFLAVQSAQAKPANTNMISLLGKGPLPISQVSYSSFKDAHKTPFKHFPTDTPGQSSQNILAKNVINWFWNTTDTTVSIPFSTMFDETLANLQFIIESLP